MLITIVILGAFACLAWQDWLDHKKHIAEIESRARANNRNPAAIEREGIRDE